MELNLRVQITEQQTLIHFEEQPDTLTIQKTVTTGIESSSDRVSFFFKDQQLVGISFDTSTQPQNFDTIATLTPSANIEPNYLVQILIDHLAGKDIALPQIDKPVNRLSPEQTYLYETYFMNIAQILQAFGYQLLAETPVKQKKTAKARHKWSKAVSQVAFHVNFRNSTAVVFWQKRTELLLKAGAIMLPEPPLNKDGSLGFAAKMGEKLREEHQHQFKQFVTTEDIVFKSVNEVGLFLYFGGTNSWLELQDQQGKSLEDWTIVTD
jgi:hypothetical protein